MYRINFVVALFMVLLFSCGEKHRKLVVHERTDSHEMALSPVRDSAFIHNYFEERFREHRFNGNVLVASHGHIVYQNSFGYSDIKKKEPLVLHDAFQLASVSKPITGLAVLKLIDEGKLQLEDSVQQHIPEFPYHDITIRDLLTHYSGLSEYMYYCDSYWDWRNEGSINNTEMISVMRQYQPSAYMKPRTKYDYCNVNFAVLASIVEKISGQSFKNYVEQEIFKKAGMDDSFVLQRELKNADPYPTKVKGHNSRGRITPLSYLDGVVGDKGIYASVGDLFKLDQLLYSNLIVRQSLLDSAYTSQHDELFVCDNYGLGWRINNSNPKRKVVYHAGWWKGFRTYFIRVLPNESTIIVLANQLSSKFSTDELFSLVGYEEERVYEKLGEILSK